MFHLYFGAFDLLLYGVAFFVSLSFSRTLAEEIDAGYEPALQTVSISPIATSPVQATAASYIACATATALPITATSHSIVSEHSTVQPSSEDPECIHKLDLQETEQGDTAADQPVISSASERPILNLSEIRTYKLRKKPVVRLCDLPSTLAVPDSIKRYILRGDRVVRLAALKTFAEVIV